MDKERFQYIVVSMIVAIILLVLFSACRTPHRHTYTMPTGVDVELPRTPQDNIGKGGAR